jgi:hypothetical protein
MTVSLLVSTYIYGLPYSSLYILCKGSARNFTARYVNNELHTPRVNCWSNTISKKMSIYFLKETGINLIQLLLILNYWNLCNKNQEVIRFSAKVVFLNLKSLPIGLFRYRVSTNCLLQRINWFDNTPSVNTKWFASQYHLSTLKWNNWNPEIFLCVTIIAYHLFSLHLLT